MFLFENARLRKYRGERSIILCSRSTSEAFTLFSNKNKACSAAFFCFLITTHFVITYAFCRNLRIRVTAFGNNGGSTQFVTASRRKNNIQTIERTRRTGTRISGWKLRTEKNGLPVKTFPWPRSGATPTQKVLFRLLFN